MAAVGERSSGRRPRGGAAARSHTPLRLASEPAARPPPPAREGGNRGGPAAPRGAAAAGAARGYYRLAGPEVAELIEALARVAPAAPVRSLREGDPRARHPSRATCYDHLAGRLGVAVMQALIADGAIAGGDGIHRFDGEDRLSRAATTSTTASRARARASSRARHRGAGGAAAALLRRLDRTSAPSLPARSGGRSRSRCSTSAGSAAWPTAGAPSTSRTPAPTGCSARSAWALR